MIAGFSLTRHREHAGRPGAERDEADVPEREHARVADEDVERDDDRDLDERVREVRLRRARDERADDRRRDDEHRRARAAAAARRAALIRAPPPSLRANSPFGPDEQDEDDGRRTGTSAGTGSGRSGAPRRAGRSRSRSRTRRASPGSGRFMPPSTTPARTMIVSRSAKSGVTSGVCTVSITATTAASAPESSTATPITRFARTPSMRDVCEVHRRGAHLQADRRPLEQQRERGEAHDRDDDRDDRDLADVDAGDRDRLAQVAERARDLAERPEPDAARRSAAGTRRRTSRRA